jgi:hypothetical protein
MTSMSRTKTIDCLEAVSAFKNTELYIPLCGDKRQVQEHATIMKLIEHGSK